MLKKNLIQKIIANTLVSLYSFVITIVFSISCSNVKNIDNSLIIGNPDYINNNFISADDFFPQLYSEDYYNYVEFDNLANPYIGDKFIMRVINDVVTRVSSSAGEIKFYVDILSKQTVDFHFSWKYGDIFLSKIYSFSIKNNI